MTKIVILDAGSQYGKVIDRKVRELSIQSEIMPLQTAATIIKDAGFKGIIISGGPASVHLPEAIDVDSEIFNLNIPILGICYGMQLMNQHFGGVVEKSDVREDGQFKTVIERSCSLFKDLDSANQTVLLTHGDSVKTLAPGFTATAKSDNLVTAIAKESRQMYGVQFHPEVDLTVNGKQILKTFLYGICGLKPTYTVGSREDSCLQLIKSTIGTSKVLVLLSGGIDSSVLAALCCKALQPNQVVALHVDNGFMRKNESQNVVKTLKSRGIDVKLINASNIFYNSTTTLVVKHTKGSKRKVVSRVLCQTLDPEEKRKIIGDTFMKVVDLEAQELNLTLDDCFLAQGTLRPDLIESANALVSSNADAIKTHHNDTELVRALRSRGRVLEPLKDFHKDEVRKLGKLLGLPSEAIARHPFPGPGLAIRVICAEDIFTCADFSHTQTMLRIIASYNTAVSKPHALLQKVHAVLATAQQREILRSYTERFPLKATLLPIKSVGVQGDSRSYGYVVGLSSDNENPDWEVLFFLAKLIPRICHSVNRVAYIFGAAVTEPIQDVTPTVLSFNVLATLRQCDDVAHQVLLKNNLYNKLSQMPVVLLPLHFDRDIFVREPSCKRSIVLRPFITSDFMTGLAARPGADLPHDVITEMVREVEKVPGISRILYDMTSKPPGTTEWE